MSYENCLMIENIGKLPMDLDRHFQFSTFT